MYATALDYQLPVAFAGIVAQVARFFRLADARGESEPVELGELGIGCAALSFVPCGGICPVCEADIEAVVIHAQYLSGLISRSNSSAAHDMARLTMAAAISSGYSIVSPSNASSVEVAPMAPQ